MIETSTPYADPVIWNVRRKDGQPLRGLRVTENGRTLEDVRGVIQVQKRGRFPYDIWRDNCHEWNGAHYSELEFEVVG